MKILHTADWHVGKGLRGRSRAEEHQAVLNEIVDIARKEEVDLVLVGGDQFDTSAPTPTSERIVYDALLQLSQTGAKVVVIAGNHDNPHRLAAIRPLLKLTNVITGAYLARPQAGGVIDVEANSRVTARIALFPFQSQRDIVKAADLMDLDPDRHQQKYDGRCREVVERLCDGFSDETVNIVLGHMTLLGAKEGGGERKAHVMGYYLPAQIFPATAHYVALGHIHKQQQIAGACPIWYCGAPLQLDFGDKDSDRSVLLIEAEPGKPAKIEPVPLTKGRNLRSIRGTLDEIEPLKDDMGDDYLRIDLEEEHRPGLGDEVRALFPNAVDVRIAREKEGDDARDDWEIDTIHSDPKELFARYLEEEDVEGEDLVKLFADLLEEEYEASGGEV